jgi:hypothetical protein
MVARGTRRLGNHLYNTATEGARMAGVLPCGYIGRREDDWEILKWFQGIRERLMNEVVEAHDGPFKTKCDYP